MSFQLRTVSLAKVTEAIAESAKMVWTLQEPYGILLPPYFHTDRFQSHPYTSNSPTHSHPSVPHMSIHP